MNASNQTGGLNSTLSDLYFVAQRIEQKEPVELAEVQELMRAAKAFGYSAESTPMVKTIAGYLERLGVRVD